MFSLPVLEVSRFRRTFLTRAALVIIVIIPVFYGAVYLAANWNPTSHLDRLNAAVVNNDQPANVTATDGKANTLRAGDQLTKTLTTGNDAGFTWHEASADTAKAQLASGQIAAILTVPKGLSSSLASLGQSDPVTSKLTIQTDDANNYITGNIAKTLLTSVQSALNSSTIANYLDNVYLGFNTIHNNIGNAADGAAKLSDGADTLEAGAVKLDDGLGQLDTGGQSLASGASKLADGAKSAASGSTALASGASQVAGGTQQLASAANAATDKATAVQAEADAALSGTQTTAVVLNGHATNVADDITAARNLVATLQQRYAADPDVQALASRIANADQNAGTIRTDITTIQTRLATVRADVKNRIDQIGAQIRVVDQQVNQLNSGAQQVSAGAGALSSGLDTLNSGASQLSTGAGALASGISSAHSGADRLASGSTSLANGAGQLASGLKDGVKKIPTYSKDDRAVRTEVVATPVTQTAVRDHPVASYGDGLAPYFIPVALWVGGMITYQILRAAPSRAYASPAPAWRIALAGYWPGVLFAVLQAVALPVMLYFVVGVRPPNPISYGAFIILVALAFTAIHQCLVAFFGGIGRLLALILLVLQLASAGGTYPIETSPGFFQAISPYLPLTHATAGIRTLIAGGDPTNAIQGVAVLVLTIAAALLVSTLAAHRKRMWSINRLHPSLTV